MKKSFVSIMIVAMTMMFAGPVAAGLVCAGGYSMNVSDTLGCELGSTNNDFLNPVLQVNTDAMFGITEWEFIFQSGSSENETQTTVFDLVMYDNEYGSFSIDWTDWDSLMLVQKDGQGDPDTYVGYLLDPADSDLSYAFLTPFTNTETGGFKDISHLSWYGVQADPDRFNVPEPAPLALMGFGLLFMRQHFKRNSG